LGKATIEVPPDAVRKSMEMKSGAPRPAPANSRKNSESIGSTVIHNYLYPPSSGRHHSRRTDTLQSSPLSSPSVRPSALRSSPIPSDSDPDAAIEDYIQWHIEKTPTHRDWLVQAKDKLLNEAMTLKALHSSSVKELQDIGIPLGISKRLCKEVRDYTHGRDPK